LGDALQIAYDARSLNHGGTGDATYLRELIRALASINPDDRYLLYANTSDPARENLAAEFANVCAHSLPYRIGWLWNQKALVPHLEQQGISLLHSQYLLPRRFRGKMIVTIHDVSFREHPEWFPRRARIIMNLLIPRSAKRADVIITGSEHARQAIAGTCNVPLEKIVVTPYAASAWARPVDADAHQDILQKYFLETPFLLGVGLRGIRKNNQIIIKALDILRQRNSFPGIKLALCGSAEQFPLEVAGHPNVQFLGWVPQEDLPPLYALAKAAVYPSLYEGFGLPVLEAMACGCPMICSNATSLPEVAGDAALQIDPHDAEAWAEAIAKVLLDEELRKGMIGKGYQQVSLFSWKKTAEQTKDIYKELY
jgi:glycosyltransferase involved in cell wall biosynthesis